ncbi:MAG: hypothetical protein PHO15_10755, partial [Eubacteriales bacterium]|nr:hypothetical protein [Eubacteriales bacterium]
MRDFFFENRWCHQIRPLSWLLDRFAPIAGWTEEEMEEAREKGREFYAVKDSMDHEITSVSPKVGILFYSDNEMSEPLATK